MTKSDIILLPVQIIEMNGDWPFHLPGPKD
jgi:hypothetical protein